MNINNFIDSISRLENRIEQTIENNHIAIAKITIGLINLSLALLTDELQDKKLSEASKTLDYVFIGFSSLFSLALCHVVENDREWGVD